MVAIAAGGKVGAGQTAERQLRAVGAAANRQHLGLNAAGKVGFLGNINKLGIVTNDLGHISILLLNLDRHTLLTQTLVEHRGGGINKVEFLLELGGVMVADDIARCGVIDGRRYTLKVIKALVAFRILRALHVGEQRVEVAEQIACVDHTTLSVAGVDGLALKADGRLGGVKALPLQLADGAAVDRVGVLAAKGIDIQQLGSVADLLVRAEANAECGMGQRRVLSDTRDKRHDLGDACLVVCAQQRGAVAADQVLTREVIQGGKLGGTHGNGFTVNRAADQVAAFVVHDVRLHAGARCNFGGVEMGDQAQGGLVLSARTCGDMRADIGVLGHVGIFRTKLAQLFSQHVGKVKLNGARGYLVAVCILGLRVDLDVAQKAFEDIGARGGVFHKDRSNLGRRVQQEL